MSSLEGAAPPPDGVIPNFQHPKDVLRTINIVSGILVIALMFPFICLRIMVNGLVMRRLVLEDCE